MPHLSSSHMARSHNKGAQKTVFTSLKMAESTPTSTPTPLKAPSKKDYILQIRQKARFFAMLTLLQRCGSFFTQKGVFKIKTHAFKIAQFIMVVLRLKRWGKKILSDLHF